MLLALVISGCATAPGRSAPVTNAAPILPTQYLFRAGAAGDAGFLVPLSFSVDSALPMVQTRTGNLFASRFNLGRPDGPLTYSASYSLSPGNILLADQLARLSAPQGLAGRRIGQAVRLKLPPVAGAPLALGLSRESEDMWTVNGNSERQRRVASLRWTPKLASVNLEAGTAAGPREPNLALDCAISGNLRVPLPAARPGRAQALQFSGRDCRVVTANPRYANLGAQTYGLAYSWRQPQRESRLRLSAIDPAWGPERMQPGMGSSYELALSQTRSRDRWSATGELGLRRAARTESYAVPDGDNQTFADADDYWTTSLTLTRRLPAFAVSANWTHGADPLWFMPDIGQQADRFGLTLDFSRWARGIAPPLTPNLALNWHWHQARSRQDVVAGNSAVRLQMSVMW
jgi:hypothetical protein